MIVRILAGGQFEVDDAELPRLNELDAEIERAVNGGDETEFRAALAALLARLREVGRPVPADALLPSDFILPGDDAEMSDVRALLSDEGLIPG